MNHDDLIELLDFIKDISKELEYQQEFTETEFQIKLAQVQLVKRIINKIEELVIK